MQEAVEGSHINHADFRVRGKIFATLPNESSGMVSLTPEMQRKFVREDPETFVPVNGAWGRNGATYVRLATARKAITRRAMMSAWRKNAPKSL